MDMKHDNDFVKVLKPTFPGVDRSLVVKVRNPERYGVDWITAAKVLISGHTSKTPQKPRYGDSHRLRHSIRCRVSERKLEGVHIALNRFKFPSCSPTVQTFVDLATDYVLEHQDEFQKWMDARANK